jgi:hypothetical protein
VRVKRTVLKRGLGMSESIAHVSPRRRLGRRVGAAGLAVAAVLVLGACQATGGGFIGDPLEGGPVSVYQGDAKFGFTFNCEMDYTKKRPRAVITGEIDYHDDPSTIDVPLDPNVPDGPAVPTVFPEIDLHGTVEPLIVPNVPSCEEAVEGLPAALFEGTYRPQDRTLRNLRGEFVVQVFDQGEPGTSQAEITGDSFSIQLIGGAYSGYTRAGYIEGGNVQVES